MRGVVRSDWRVVRDLFVGFLIVALSLLCAFRNFNLSSIFPFGEGVFLAGVVGFGLALSIMDWRKNVQFVLYLVVFEGAFRKWLLPEQSATVYLAKDIVILFAYLGYVFSKRTQPSARLGSAWTFFHWILFLFLGFGALQLLNPRAERFEIGILGLKAYFLYIPLVYLAKDLFRSREELIQWINRIALLVIPIGILGWVQFLYPNTHPINRYVWGESEIAVFGLARQTRITGTFSYIAGYSVYLTFAFCVLSGFILSQRASVLRLFFNYLGWVICVGNLFMTGSRAPVFQAVLASLFFTLFFWRRIVYFVSRYFVRMILLNVLVLAGVVRFFPDAIQSFKERVIETGSDEAVERIQEMFRFPEDAMELAGWFGYGIGSTHQAAQQLASVLDVPDLTSSIDFAYEEEPERVMLELGGGGFFIFYLFKISICFLAFRILYSLRKEVFSPFALGLFAYLILQIQAPLVFNHVLNVLFWVCLSILIAFHHLTYRKDSV